MLIHINNKPVSNEDKQNVSFRHRGFVISIAQGASVIGPASIIVFPDEKREIIDPDFKIELLHRNYTDIPSAIDGVNRLADAIDLGLIEVADEITST